MGEIKAIPTIYKGIPFRSKLEAQWAKFFDAEGIAYIYEPEGYEFKDGTRYLPDFYLPDAHQFFEVKGVMSELDIHKIKRLIKESNRAVTIGYGDGGFCACDYGAGGNPDESWDEYQDFMLTDKYGRANDSSVLVKCETCGKKWFMGTAGWFKCQCCGEYDGDHHIAEWRYSNETDWYEKAYINIKKRGE